MEIDRDRCGFETKRLRCGTWVEEAERIGSDLAQTVADLLTRRTTVGLPAAWHGEFTVERASAWIAERETDSTTLLITEKTTRQPIGLVILGDIPLDRANLDVRVGYLLGENSWGQGFGTEVVTGLVEWAREQPAIATLTGGVDSSNRASIRVLERSGFQLIGEGDRDSMLFQVDVGNEWDACAPSWDDDPAARAYAAAAFSSLLDLVRRDAIALDGARVLDFGCGTGLLTELLFDAGAIVDAVDTSDAMLAVLRSKTRLHESRRLVTSTGLPAPDQRFRVAVCSSVCSFLVDYPESVAEIVARLEPGGLFVQWDWERSPGDDHGLTRDEIVAALETAGLVDIEVGVGFEIDADGQRLAPLMGHGRRASRR